jgi:cytochrome c oxidase subunit 2
MAATLSFTSVQIVAATASPLTNVARMQGVLAPVGPQAARISSLWWFMFWACTVIFILVIGALLYAVWRPRPAQDERVIEAGIERGKTRVVTGAVVVTVIMLFVFLVLDFLTGRALSALSTANALTIKVTGHQWWWEVQYEAPVPSQIMTTANEIHIPVGQPVLFELRSNDVIHSFWVPNLHGKRDLIPGYETTMWLQADRPGVFRGQCAEFCGHQHAHMALLIVAEPPKQFSLWMEGQRHAAVPPADPIQQRGQHVFLTSSCVMCHSIRGTPAGGKVAPDLTHLASRQTLAAGTLPNTRGHLAAWIVDSQGIKPGNKCRPITSALKTYTLCWPTWRTSNESGKRRDIAA